MNTAEAVAGDVTRGDAHRAVLADAGVCGCGDYSCESAVTGTCVNRDDDHLPASREDHPVWAGPYDEDDRCEVCREHIANPHAPTCVWADELDDTTAPEVA